MEKILFNGFTFVVDEKLVYIQDFNGIGNEEDSNLYKFHNFVEVSILGDNKDSHLGNKLSNSSEWNNLKYESHTLKDNELVFNFKTNKLAISVNLLKYDNTNATRVNTTIKNITNEDLIIEELSIFKLPGIGSIDNANNLYFTRFFQSHHAECQPRTYSFFDLGMHRGNYESQKKIEHTNIGSWSTKEELPQGIINLGNSNFLMFEIESNSLWHYEIADRVGKYYLYLGGNNLINNGWRINLKPNESYSTNYASICFGKSINEVVANMTNYRRNIYYKNEYDKELPPIFNEYMHLSWDNPSEEKTAKYAPLVKEMGVKYYVIDCGWHDEVDTDIIYKYVGKWEESKRRFPHGIKATIDYLHSLGLKAGLWIEPEIVGMNNQEMIDYYGDDSFITRNGKKVIVMNRLFLDYRKEKVIDYMSKTIDRMVNEYGADYIKMDYNQEQGVGTDDNAFSFGSGLEDTTNAFFDWVKKMEEKYPQVLFEGCSSGGMRMDYKTLSSFPLISTSDQVDANKYPYIACNILAAAIPEQAAVWAYPVSHAADYELAKDRDWVHENISDEFVALNMINSFLGRIHLASDLDLLTDSGKALVKEGIEFYESLTSIKKVATPYFPLGFTKFYDTNCCGGLKTNDKLCLAIYNLKGNNNMKIDIQDYKNVERCYPKVNNVKLKVKGNNLLVKFNKETEAIFVILDK